MILLPYINQSCHLDMYLMKIKITHLFTLKNCLFKFINQLVPLDEKCPVSQIEIN